MVKMKAVFIFHLIVSVFFIIAWKGVRDLGLKVTELRKKPLGLETRFMTNWNFCIQTVLFYGYLLHDILDFTGLFISLKTGLKNKLDFYFYSINAPTTFLVAGVFWGMCAYDKRLMFPAGLEEIMPDWVNHSIHTVIMFNVLIQTYFNKTEMIKFTKSFFAFAVFNLCYLICLYGTYFEKRMWVYPFLEKMEEPYRLLFLSGLFVVSTFIFILYHIANSWYCGKCSMIPQKSLKSGQRKKQK